MHVVTVVVSLYLCSRNSAHNYNCYCIMTKEEFEVLQLDLQQSGKPLMSYLKDAGVKYSTYTYWRRKMEYEHKPEHPIAPISFTRSSGSVFTGTVSSGATLLFPNGLRAHFGSGTEDVLRELLDKSLVSHVLPE